MRWGPAILLLSLACSLGAGGKSDDDCKGDVCFRSLARIKVTNPDTTSKELPLQSENCNVEVKTTDLVSACLPGVDSSFVAKTFSSCEGKAMKKTCKHSKRGWLTINAQNETVENTDVLLAIFKQLEGGEEAVKQCLNIEDEYEYYYYDYEYYDDDYDYLEEADGAVGRVRRSPAKCDNKCKRLGPKKCRKTCPNVCCNKARSSKKNAGKSKKKPGKNCSKVDCRDTPKNKCCKQARNGKKSEGKPKKNCKNNPDKKGCNKPEEKPEKRKHTNKKPSDEAAKKVDAKLARLGLLKAPSKTTLDRLDCVSEEVPKLLAACGKAKLQKPSA